MNNDIERIAKQIAIHDNMLESYSYYEKLATIAYQSTIKILIERAEKEGHDSGPCNEKTRIAYTASNWLKQQLE